MPFQIILWTPVDNQKINQTQKSIYTLLHSIHSSIYISLRYCRSASRLLDGFIANKLFDVRNGFYIRHNVDRFPLLQDNSSVWN